MVLQAVRVPPGPAVGRDGEPLHDADGWVGPRAIYGRGVEVEREWAPPVAALRWATGYDPGTQAGGARAGTILEHEMGVTYQLVNLTKRERVSFLHIGACKQRELAGNPVASAITTWYLLENRGDDIAFVADIDDARDSFRWVGTDHASYPDMTEQVVAALLANGILQDHGKSWCDEGDPDVYIRDLRNIWMTDGA